MMNDLISRQTVAKLLDGWLLSLNENCHKQSASDLKMIINDFKNLPSLQLGTNLAEVGTNLVSKQAVIDLWDKYHYSIATNAIKYDRALRNLPSIQPERKMGHWICESQWSDTMGTYWNTWKCDQCNVVAAKGWEHTRDGMKPNGKFCSECGAPMDKKVIFINITEKE